MKETIIHTPDQSDHLQSPAELREIIIPLLEQADLLGPQSFAAIMLKPIRNRNRENHFYPPELGTPVRMAEIMSRRDGGGVRTARLYFDVATDESGLPYIPVVCMGPQPIVSRLAERERLQAVEYTDSISVSPKDDVTINHDELLRLRGLRQVLDQPALAYAKRRATFRLTSVSAPRIDGKVFTAKHYDNLVDPQSGEYFAHLLSADEVSPLLPETAIGLVAGICVTNSGTYMSNHPELQFIPL